MKERRVVGAIVLGATFLFSLAPLVRGGDLPTAEHHLLHAAILAGAAFAGILFASTTTPSPRRMAWLIAALVAPMVAMLLMWPSEYAFFEQHKFGHVLEHLGILVCGFVSGYGGQRFARGIGWAAGTSAVAMGVLAAWGYGTGATAGAAVAAAAAGPASASATATADNGDAQRGATVFAKNCAVCHGVGGAGGEGPPLRNESAKKDFAQTRAWIENPAPPMPKLYPGTLSDRDLDDVAAYVHSLK